MSSLQSSLIDVSLSGARSCNSSYFSVLPPTRTGRIETLSVARGDAERTTPSTRTSLRRGRSSQRSLCPSLPSSWISLEATTLVLASSSSMVSRVSFLFCPFSLFTSADSSFLLYPKALVNGNAEHLTFSIGKCYRRPYRKLKTVEGESSDRIPLNERLLGLSDSAFSFPPAEETLVSTRHFKVGNFRSSLHL